MSTLNRSQTVMHVYNSLARVYGKVRKNHKRNPFDQLILCILGHCASENAAQKALDLLLKEYVDWNEVRVCTVSSLGETLAEAGIDSPIAAVLKSALQGICKKQFAVNLDFLMGMKHDEARKSLTELDSLPEQIVSAMVLACYDGLPVPVDEELARVIRRLGIVKPSATMATVERFLRRTVPKRESYNFFRVFVRHARLVCRPVSPDCAGCTVRRICRYGVKVQKEARTQRDAAKRGSRSAAKGGGKRTAASKKAAKNKTGKATKKASKAGETAKARSLPKKTTRKAPGETAKKTDGR